MWPLANSLTLRLWLKHTFILKLGYRFRISPFEAAGVVYHALFIDKCRTSRRIVFYTPLESLAPRVESSPSLIP